MMRNLSFTRSTSETPRSSGSLKEDKSSSSWLVRGLPFQSQRPTRFPERGLIRIELRFLRFVEVS
jgi:hypothetical protein